MRVVLVNTNRIEPPIGPIALDYLAESLNASGHQTRVLDLCWADDWSAAVDAFFRREEVDLIGVTLRNTDDCAYTSGCSFLGVFSEMISALRRASGAPIVAGGVGFSVIPEEVLDLCGADAGVWGEGEFVLPRMAAALETGEEWRDLPGFVWRAEEGWRRNPPEQGDLASLPVMSRRWIDNRRYFRRGGQAGIETKRGCDRGCIYCADPVAKGRRIRLRPPEAVAEELERLLEEEIDHVHTCDSEFNLPPEHAEAVSRELIRRGLGERLRWYAYCAPKPFPPELAGLMRRAGCVGINFGVDSFDVRMLRVLRRDHGPEDVMSAVRACREQGITVMLDLLFGAPGESAESIRATVEAARRSGAQRIGVAAGVRVYPGTPLGHRLGRDDPGLRVVSAGGPLFHLEPGIAEDVFGLIDEAIGDDDRFLFFDPSRPAQNYNYNANQRLTEAIGSGHRGAYWDVLRRLDEER